MKNFIKNLDTPNEYFYFSDKKNLIGDLACFMINSNCLFFDDFKPYIKLRTHYQYIPDTEILISILTLRIIRMKTDFSGNTAVAILRRS